MKIANETFLYNICNSYTMIQQNIKITFQRYKPVKTEILI